MNNISKAKQTQPRNVLAQILSLAGFKLTKSIVWGKISRKIQERKIYKNSDKFIYIHLSSTNWFITLTWILWPDINTQNLNEILVRFILSQKQIFYVKLLPMDNGISQNDAWMMNPPSSIWIFSFGTSMYLISTINFSIWLFFDRSVICVNFNFLKMSSDILLQNLRI